MKFTSRLLPESLARRFALSEIHARCEAGPLAGSLGRVGSLEVRMARNAKEVKLAQALRFAVFYKELSAQARSTALLRRRDADGFDALCDHLLVIDHDPDPQIVPARLGRPAVVGTYRLLRQEIAEQFDGFYTAGEFDIEGLIERKRPLRFLELGRSCVLKPYRNKRTLELLWSGNWTYVQHYGIDVMIGCASLQGTDADALALPLSFLHHTALAPEEWRVTALPGKYVPTARLSGEEIDARTALHALPPLLKGYLRLGAYVGDGAVIDRQFGTTDVCVVLPVSSINPRYFGHFGAPAERLS